MTAPEPFRRARIDRVRRRPHPDNATALVDKAIDALRTARALLHEAGAMRTKARVDLAISSALGARRNVAAEPYRTRERVQKGDRSA